MNRIDQALNLDARHSLIQAFWDYIKEHKMINPKYEPCAIESILKDTVIFLTNIQAGSNTFSLESYTDSLVITRAMGTTLLQFLEHYGPTEGIIEFDQGHYRVNGKLPVMQKMFGLENESSSIGSPQEP